MSEVQSKNKKLNCIGKKQKNKKTEHKRKLKYTLRQVKSKILRYLPLTFDPRQEWYSA